MCVTSMITDHYMQNYPAPMNFPTWQWPTYQELMDKARKYDEMMAQKACPDPSKIQWQQELERVMKERYGLTPNDPSLAASGTSTSAQDR